MAAKTKTTWTNANVNDFINSFVDKDEKKQDSLPLVAMPNETHPTYNIIVDNFICHTSCKL